MRMIWSNFMALVALAGLWSAIATAGQTQSHAVVVTKQDFDGAVFSLENAIVDRGLVIDTTGHVGAMLKRTAKATGRSSPYIGARYVGFCSAKLSAEAMAADPDNLAICPYVMFVYELKAEPGKARIGYRRPAGSDAPASKAAVVKIEKLMADILKEASQ